MIRKNITIILLLVIFLSLPLLVFAKEEVVLKKVEVDEHQGDIKVEYFTNDIEQGEIVGAELISNGETVHKWHRDDGEGEGTTYAWDFGRSSLNYKSPSEKYMEGDYQLKLSYDKSMWSGVKTVASDSLNYTPPDDYKITEQEYHQLREEAGQAMPLANKVRDLYDKIVKFVAGPLAILFIIYGGYLYITSTGNPEQIGMAKEVIVGAITGLIVLLLAGLILNTIGTGSIPSSGSSGQPAQTGGQSGSSQPTTN